MKKSVLMVLMLLMEILLLGHSLAAEDAPDCNLERGSCITKIGDKEITFDVSPKPVKAMEELAFRLVIKRNPPSPPLRKGGQEGMKELPEKITVDLSMPGMYMGKNQVLLKKGPDGTYSGKGIIPKCRSGRRLWRATVDIPKTGKVDFTFNVSY